MNSMGVRATLAVLLLFIATGVAAEGGVTFWKTSFTMTCPREGEWFMNDKNLLGRSNTSTEYTVIYDNKKKGPYRCEYDDEGVGKNYYFYVQGKVCENCFELDPPLFALAIIADVLMTAGVMMIIYSCTKKKSSAGLTQTPKAPARSGGRAPTGQSIEYEQLNINTRSQDTYSVVNKTG